MSKRTIINCGNNYYVTGGSDRYMFELESLLTKHGYTVIPFAPRHNKNNDTIWQEYFPSTFQFKDVRLKDLPKYFYSFSAKKNLSRLLNNTKVDLAHLHIYHGSLTESILSPLKKEGVPRVQSLHDYRLACPVNSMVSNDKVCESCAGHNYYRALNKRCNRGSFFRTTTNVASAYFSKFMGAHSQIDHFIAVSDFMKRKMLKYNIGNGKISTIHNFADVDLYEPDFVPGKYFLYFGRIEKIKGLSTLIEAMKNNIKYPLYIVGEGEYKEVLLEKISKEGLHHIKVFDFMSGKKLAAFIKGSLCTILPSEWYENCPMSIIESYAYGKPVIGARIGGIPELIDDEQDGFLFTPGEHYELAEKIKWISHNENKICALGKAGRRKIESRFNAEDHYRKINDLYTRILTGKV